ncbi:uncharacterized protein RBU33_012524 [Hipposideros larvatus]
MSHDEVSTNAVHHDHELCSPVSQVGGNRRGQHIRSATDEPHPGTTTLETMVSPLPGKYAQALLASNRFSHDSLFGRGAVHMLRGQEDDPGHPLQAAWRGHTGGRGPPVLE